MKFIASLFTILLTVFQLYPKPLIIAHRGASKRAPENTMAAFKLAFRKHADAVEVDVRLTKDNIIICHHDDNLMRMTGKDLNISEVTYNQIKDLEVGNNFSKALYNAKIPKLEDLLSKVSRRKKIFIEIKTGIEIISPLEKTIIESKVKLNNLTLISFNTEVIRLFKECFPTVKTLLLVNLKNSDYSINGEIDSEKILKVLKDINTNGISCKSNSTVNKDLVAKIVEEGYEFHVWTVDSKEKAIELKNMGVHSITTNYPKRIRKAIH